MDPFTSDYGLSAVIPTANGGGSTMTTGTVPTGRASGPTDFFTGLFGGILNVAANTWANGQQAKQQLAYDQAKAAQQQQQAGALGTTVMQTGLMIVAGLAAVVAVILIFRAVK